MNDSDFLPENTPRGLPGPLPRGERILWQGAPTSIGITLRAFHAPLVAAWFGITALALAAGTAANGAWLHGLGLTAPTLLIGTGALLLLLSFGWLVHRTTVYTITNKRVVMHIGIALPITLNLPFAEIESAGVRTYADGSGDVPLVLRDRQRVAYLHLWPHARPWRVARPEPMLRSVPDAQAVAGVLARALAAHTGAVEGGTAPVAVRPRAAGSAGGFTAATAG